MNASSVALTEAVAPATVSFSLFLAALSLAPVWATLCEGHVCVRERVRSR